MRRPLSRRAVLGLPALLIPAGLVVAPATASASVVNGPIGRGEVMDRAWSWIAERVPYSQSRWHANRFGSYRADCSGYVSMAWHLDHSRTTWTLWDVTHTVPAHDLQPGDCLLRDSGGVDHVALFARWSDAARTKPVVREEYDWGRVCEERVWGDGLRGFTPRRYNRIDELVPYGEIGAKYHALGGAGGPLGRAIRGERDSRLQGRFQQFAQGMIIWHGSVGAFAVYGDILTRYWATDSEVRWGFPTMDELAAHAGPSGTTGRYQYFQRGLFLWSAPHGARAVHGEILRAFEAGGRERSLGYPVTEETPRVGGGFDQRFENATIHWTPAQGAWITRG